VPHYAVKVHAIVEVEAADKGHAQDTVRDLLVSDRVIRYLISKCEPVLWEGEDNGTQAS
jgi:hypothetical protein